MVTWICIYIYNRHILPIVSLITPHHHQQHNHNHTSRQHIVLPTHPTHIDSHLPSHPQETKMASTTTNMKMHTQPMEEEELFEWQAGKVQFYSLLCGVTRESTTEGAGYVELLNQSAEKFKHDEGWAVVENIYNSIELLIRRESIIDAVADLFPVLDPVEDEKYRWMTNEKGAVRLWLVHYLTEMRARHFPAATLMEVSVPDGYRTWNYDPAQEDGLTVPDGVVIATEQWMENVSADANIPNRFSNEDIIMIFNQYITGTKVWDINAFGTDKLSVVLLLTALEASRQVPLTLQEASSKFATFGDYKNDELFNWEKIATQNVKNSLSTLLNSSSMSVGK